MPGLMRGSWKRGTVPGPQRLRRSAWTAPDLSATAPVPYSTLRAAGPAQGTGGERRCGGPTEIEPADAAAALACLAPFVLRVVLKYCEVELEAVVARASAPTEVDR